MFAGHFIIENVDKTLTTALNACQTNQNVVLL